MLWAGLQLALHAPMGLFQEVVRANIATWYRELVDRLPEVQDGQIAAPTHPGIGARLLPEVKARPGHGMTKDKIGAARRPLSWPGLPPPYP